MSLKLLSRDLEHIARDLDDIAPEQAERVREVMRALDARIYWVADPVRRVGPYVEVSE